MSDPQPRQPAGVPVGGQFTTTSRTEADVALPASGPFWVLVEREHGDPLAVGPFSDAFEALEFMNDSMQIQGIAEEDALDIFVTADKLGPEVTQIPVVPEKEIDRLTDLARELGVDPSDLDGTVRDVTDQMASNLVNGSDEAFEDAQGRHYGEMDAYASSVNNGGLPRQIALLVEHVGAERTEQIVRECMASRAANAAPARPGQDG